jgi:hypothetical protein
MLREQDTGQLQLAGKQGFQREALMGVSGSDMGSVGSNRGKCIVAPENLMTTMRARPA